MLTPNNELRYDMVILDVGGTLLGFRDPVPFQEFLVYARLPATDDDARAFHRRFVHVIVADRDAAKGLGVDNAALDSWWRAIFAKTWPDRPDLAAEMFRWFREDRSAIKIMLPPLGSDPAAWAAAKTRLVAEAQTLLSR